MFFFFFSSAKCLSTTFPVDRGHRQPTPPGLQQTFTVLLLGAQEGKRNEAFQLHLHLIHQNVIGKSYLMSKAYEP